MKKDAPTETDLGSYEGKYPKDLFNKTVIVNEQAMGRVAKETDDQIVVFSDSGNLRFDIPKSKITLSGGSVMVGEPLEQYAVDKDAPMPEDRSLRPSAEEIRQKAGEIPAANEKYSSVEGPTLPIEERKPSMAEEKVRDAATEVKTSVGYELGQASKAVKEKMKDAGEAVVNVDVEGAASRIKDVAQTGAEAAKGKMAAAQSNTEAGLSVESSMKIEKELKQPSTETDLGSYEGKYPKDFFNRTVTLNDRPIGRVAKETEEIIVVFSDTDSSIRFDIPKSEISVAGASVIANEDLLFRYRTHRDAPMPEDRSLRPSAEEIRQKAGEIPEEPTIPVEERKPSMAEEKVRDAATMAEEKVRDAATEVKTSVGYELGQASKAVKEKMKDAGEAVVNVDVEGAARQAASRIKDVAQTGAEAAKEKMAAAQSNTEAGLSSENMMKFEKESKQSSTETDLGSYEGKYPKDLFNKTVIVNEQAMGRVAKETEDQIVVFSDSGNLRFDIPKSKIALSGGSIVVGERIEQYAVDRDAPMPEDRALRASVQEIRESAGDVPEGPTLPIEERKPSIVEEKVRDAATEVKSSVGYELGQASKAVKEKMKDAGEAVMNVDVEGLARQAAGGIKDFAQSGAEAAKEKMGTAQSSSEAGLSVENMMKFEKESKQSSTETDLGSYEGKYPKGFFNKTVVVNNRPIGRVAKETDEVIVVFSDTDSSIRFDIPKSEISTAGASVIASEDLLFRYRAHRDAPMPEGRALRASVQEIRAASTEQLEIEKKSTTADSVMEEGRQLATLPRPETTSVSRPEGYIDTESEISKKMKGALAELKEIIVAGTKVAKKKAKQAQENAAEKRAEMDGEAISRMGDLAMRFADSFEDILSEIRTRTYTEQVQIYTGFIKLIDQQRTLVLARREFADRLKDSVNVPVVGPQDQDRKTRELKAPPELPEDLEGNRSLSEGKSTTTTTAKRRKRISSSRTTRRKA